MKLKEIIEGYDPKSPRGNVIAKLASECHVNLTTIYRWINGDVIPSQLYQEKVAEVLNTEIDW